MRKLKYSVGYRIYPHDEFINRIIEYKDSIHEVYFAWGDFPNGRQGAYELSGMPSWEAQAKQIHDLSRLSEAGIRLDMLFNAACYGKDSQSRAFFEKTGEAVQYVKERFGLDTVTTTSPLIARFVKDNFEGIETRASVNMAIGTAEGMEYLEDVFDGFYLKRELNRDFEKISELRRYCDEKGKKLYALCNSGCLNNCSAHTFHDSLVAHEKEISAMDNGYNFEGACRAYLKKGENRFKILERTNFIRPEDIHLYEEFFTVMKLATRVSPNPFRILDAYIKNNRYVGNVLELAEPDHSGILYPYVLDNGKITSNIIDKKLVYGNIENALTKLEEDIYVNE
ncbi:MAG: hypothetical protein IJO52_01430 [Clostridia bacterium]|nr:hypothetical protein [Clostridia bacterium]